MAHPRTAIRYYAWNLLKDGVSLVNGRVFLNRANPILVQELPAINVFFDSEENEVIDGDRYVPHKYERTMNLGIDIFAEQPSDPSGTLRIEDTLDSIARQVEDEFCKDIFFQKRLDGYDGNIGDPGLLAGHRLLSTIPAQVEIDSDRVIATQSITFGLIYTDDAIREPKGDIFESYLVKINRVGWTDETIDPTLIRAEGDF